MDRFEKEFEKVVVERGVKYVDDGSIITSGGIPAGINMSSTGFAGAFPKDCRVDRLFEELSEGGQVLMPLSVLFI